MRNKYLAILLLIVIGASCVPRKKLVYLQDPNQSDDIVTNQIINEYKATVHKHRLKAEDIVSIKVFTLTPQEFNFFFQSETQLRDETNVLLSGFIVDDEGFIELPVVGKFFAQGLTLEEAEEGIKEMLDGPLEKPTVVVKLLNFNYTVLGEVNRPGPYTNYGNTINLLEALAQAGDLTDFADRATIKVVRFENDIASTFYLNLLDETVLTSPYFYLKPNDLIYVAPLEVKSTRNYGLQNFGLIFSTLTALTLLVERIVNN